MFERTVSARFSLFLPSSRAASPAVGSMSTYGSPGKTAGPAAGHTPYAASWTAKLSRTGQTHAWRAHTSPPRRGGRPVPVFSPDRPGWNERIPVWEQRIPQWQSGQSGWQTAPMLSTRQQQPTRAFLTPSPSMASQTSAHIVTRDWSLLFSPGRVDTLIRRPWPEYEPESSAAVGRRWNGCNLGRLYEHVPPALNASASSGMLSPGEQ